MLDVRRLAAPAARSTLLLWMTLTAVVTPGCGDGAGEPTVYGVVTYEGEPVTSGLINFLSPGGKPLGGALQPDGSYEVRLPPGDYQVRIDSPEEFAPAQLDPQGRPLPPEVIKPRQVPLKFAGFESSGLKASVADEPARQQLDFKLP